MKRKLLIGIPLAGLLMMALSCSLPASPAKAPPDGQPRTVLPAPSGSPAAAAPAAPPGREADGFGATLSPSGPAAAPRAPGTTSGEQGGGAPPEKASFDRMIIYNAQASMEVKDVTDSMEAIANIAASQRGFVVNSSFRFEGERKVATVTIKVPALTFQATLAELRRLAIKVEDEISKSQDVTEEFSDLRAQVDNLKATEARYLDLLRRANTIDEILKVQARIDETRRQIDRIQGRMDYLDKTSEMASITISLFSKDGKVLSKPEQGGWWKTPGEAFEQSLFFLGRVASAIAIGVAFFWWAIILAAAAAFVVWRGVTTSTQKA